MNCSSSWTISVADQEWNPAEHFIRVCSLMNSYFSFCIILVPETLWANRIICRLLPASCPQITLRFSKMVKKVDHWQCKSRQIKLSPCSREEQSTSHVQHILSLLQVCSHALVFRCLKRWASAARKIRDFLEPKPPVSSYSEGNIATEIKAWKWLQLKMKSFEVCFFMTT